jgi:hypothetical protein
LKHPPSEETHAVEENVGDSKDRENHQGYGTSWRRSDAQDFSELNAMFVTPLDREDIHLLASSLDDMMDHISQFRCPV